ncbi:MAG: acylphosphatase [Candidatus Margulisiibacteriota bacterium]
MPQKRVEVHYSGRVHGVGFRYTVTDAAAKFQITGYVKNLASEQVELVAEGDEEILKTFLDNIYLLMQRYIEKYTIDWSDYTGEFKRFEIRY